LLYCDEVAADILYKRLIEQPFNVQSIKEFITHNKLSKRVITDAALRMCIMGEHSHDNFVFANNREPKAGELFTHDWEERFTAIIECGIDPEMTFGDGRYSDCIYESLEYIDDGDLGARMLCRLLEKYGLPKRLTFDGVPYFDEVDSTFITDIALGLYDDNKPMYDRSFRYWAVLIGNGATRTDGNEVITMQNGYDVNIMKKYDLLDYEEVKSKGELNLRIFRKDTGETVAYSLIR